MRGDRFKPLTYEQMTPEQKKMTDIAVAQRGTGGSFNISVRDPDGGQLFFDMGDRVRFHMSVPDKLKELAIILTARYWGAQFEWLAHRRAAVQAGLSEDKVKAIAEGRRPVGMSADEEAVYNFITELFKTRQVERRYVRSGQERRGRARRCGSDRQRGLLSGGFDVHEYRPSAGECQPAA